jgi:uroporphyrin-3 C-methyltransferase
VTKQTDGGKTGETPTTTPKIEAKDDAKIDAKIDGKAKAEAKATPPKQPAHYHNNNPEEDETQGSWFVALLKLLVKLALVLIILGAGYVAYLSYENNNQVAAQINTQSLALKALEKQVNQVSSAVPDLRKDVAATIKDNQENLDALHGYVTETALRLTASQGVTRYEWLLAEAEYLMRLAQQRLVLERDTLGALSILQSADKVLADAADTNLITVRQQLAREMAALAAVRSVDREGLYVQISLMIESVESWSPAASLSEQQPDITHDNAAPTWQERLSQYIRISRVDAMDREPIQPHLIPLYRALLQNALSQAQTAILRQQPDAYRIAIQSARTFYDRYGASPGSPSQLDTQLEQLSTLTLDSELPRLGGALTLLKEYIASVYQLQRTAPKEQ